MLKVYYGDLAGAVFNTEIYFKYSFEEEWLDNPLVRKIVKDIDKSEVIDRYLIKSPVLGMIPPAMLSGAVKTLILIINEPGKIFNASTCGNNCAKWIIEIGSLMDVTINLRHLMDFGPGSFEIEIVNTNQVVHSMRELLPIAVDCLDNHEVVSKEKKRIGEIKD